MRPCCHSCLPSRWDSADVDSVAASDRREADLDHARTSARTHVTNATRPESSPSSARRALVRSCRSANRRLRGVQRCARAPLGCLACPQPHRRSDRSSELVGSGRDASIAPGSSVCGSALRMGLGLGRRQRTLSWRPGTWRVTSARGRDSSRKLPSVKRQCQGVRRVQPAAAPRWLMTGRSSLTYA